MPPLSVEYLTDGMWKLKSDLHYFHEVWGKITVPAGTVTDLDSVPRLPFVYLAVKNCSVLGASVHDHLYATGKVRDLPISRATADRIFLDAMEWEGVARWRRRLIWAGVRAGGWISWRRHRS